MQQWPDLQKYTTKIKIPQCPNKWALIRAPENIAFCEKLTEIFLDPLTNQTPCVSFKTLPSKLYSSLILLKYIVFVVSKVSRY